MSKLKKMLPYEIRQGRDSCDVVKYQIVTEKCKKVMMDKQEVQKIESPNYVYYDYECEISYEYYDGL